MIIFYNRIFSLITTSVPEISDFKNLTINGAAENITVTPEYIPKIGEVYLNEIV